MLTLEEVSIQKQRKFILSDINISVEESSIVCIVGRNGAGKSTLLRAIVGIEPLANGSIIYNGTDMLSENRYYALWEMGVLLTTDALYNYLTCEDNLKIIQRYYGKTRFSVEQIISLFDLSSYRSQKVRSLSSGMKQRLSLSIAFINCPSLVILDEPFNSIDRENTRQIVKLIQQLNRDYNTTFVITSHSFDDIESLYSSLIVLKNGKIVSTMDRLTLEKLFFFKINISKIPLHFSDIKKTFPDAVLEENFVMFIADMTLASDMLSLLHEGIEVQRPATAKDIYELIG